MAIQDEEDEKPLDPAVLRVQARLRGLMLVAGGTLGLGLLAVMLAIVYRIATLDDSDPTSPATILPAADFTLGNAVATEIAVQREVLGVAPTARLVATALAGDRALLTFADDDALIAITIDLRTGTVISRLRIAGP